ncbi:MAG: response regulator, partial [Leptolyngbya sp. SIO3F4]|nr:response regulator [Leptolyngbya sp. SIO3F4]
MDTAHTLLIVDDCAEDREVYREYLSSDPHNTYEFCEAALAEVGLELFLKQQFDVVLLDFYMPDMTGLEFLGQLQKHQRSRGQYPIIMLTGQGNEELAVRAMKHGVQDYLGKQHLQPEVLQRTVRSVIQQSHLHVALHKTREQQRLIATTALRIRQSLDLSQIL